MARATAILARAGAALIVAGSILGVLSLGGHPRLPSFTKTAEKQCQQGVKDFEHAAIHICDADYETCIDTTCAGDRKGTCADTCDSTMQDCKDTANSRANEAMAKCDSIYSKQNEIIERECTRAANDMYRAGVHVCTADEARCIRDQCGSPDGDDVPPDCAENCASTQEACEASAEVKLASAVANCTTKSNLTPPEVGQSASSVATSYEKHCTRAAKDAARGGKHACEVREEACVRNKCYGDKRSDCADECKDAKNLCYTQVDDAYDQAVKACEGSIDNSGGSA